MSSIKETGRFLADFVSHPRQTLQEVDSELNKMMLLILSSGSACEPGMDLPMIERTPEIEGKEGKKK